MPREIWKFPINNDDKPTLVFVPVGSRVIHVDRDPLHEDIMCVWVEFDSGVTTREARWFSVHGTGHKILGG